MASKLKGKHGFHALRDFATHQLLQLRVDNGDCGFFGFDLLPQLGDARRNGEYLAFHSGARPSSRSRLDSGGSSRHRRLGNLSISHVFISSPATDQLSTPVCAFATAADLLSIRAQGFMPNPNVGMRALCIHPQRLSARHRVESR
jgi:hypothetical protein